MPTVLPLYDRPVRARVEDTSPEVRDPSCARCALHKGVRTVCMGPEGQLGGLLVVAESPSKEDDRAGRQSGLSRANKTIRYLVSKHWKGAVTYDHAVRCHAGAREVTLRQVEACRGFLAATVAVVRPKRVICVGAQAAQAVLGRTVAPFTNRRAYGWLANGVPAFVLINPAAGAHNRFVDAWVRRDFEWALTVDVRTLQIDAPFAASARVVETPADADEAVRELSEHPWVAFDCETAGLMHTPDFALYTVSVCGAEMDDPWVWDERALRDPACVAPLRALLTDPRVGKVGHNVKFDMLAVRLGLGVVPTPVVGDTRLWRKVGDPEADGHLDVCAELVGMGGHKEEMEVEKKRVIKACRAPNASAADLAALGPAHLVQAVREGATRPEAFVFGLVDPVARQRYCARDTLATARLGVRLRAGLTRVPDLVRTFDTLVMPASIALERVEAWGVAADAQAVQAYQASLLLRQDDLAQRFTRFGPGFNPNSPQQVASLLFNKMRLVPEKHTKTGKPSTDADSLAAMAKGNEVVADLLEWRRVTKLRGTYADALVAHIRPDGRIHPTILPDGARTGRLSCIEPNLQNIPRAKDSLEGKMARDCFAAPPGTSLVQLDYSQLELRIAAMLSGDDEMIRIFRSGVDYHRRTAELIAKTAWGIEPDAVTDVHRTQAKAVNFGVLYGQGPGALAASIGCSWEQAERVMKALFGRFTKLHAWTEGCLHEARQTGFIWTWWDGHRARRRPMWRVADEDSQARSRAEHGAWNTPVQGTATEFCTQSLIRVVEWIERERVPAKLVLPVHDSLMLEVREDLVQEVAERVRGIMLGFNSMGVPLDVDVEIGPAWGSLVKQKRAQPAQV